jgi:hypothetical protein
MWKTDENLPANWAIGKFSDAVFWYNVRRLMTQGGKRSSFTFCSSCLPYNNYE